MGHNITQTLKALEKSELYLCFLVLLDTQAADTSIDKLHAALRPEDPSDRGFCPW